MAACVSSPNTFGLHTTLLKITIAIGILFLVGFSNNARAATYSVPPGGDLYGALAMAQCGDTIILEAGAVFTVAGLEQPFALRPKCACTGTDADWITIQSSNLASLPPSFRALTVQELQALNLPKLVTNTSTPALEAVAQAHHYRVIGIEIKNDSRGQAIVNNGLVFAGIVHGSSPPLTFATVPHHIEFDRLWVHSEEDGTDSTVCTALRGFLLGAADITIKNSRIAGFRAFVPGSPSPQSSQAILIEKGPGPYNIAGNFLEAWFTSIFTGGGPQWITNQATVAAGATNSQATLSNVNNLVVGDYIAFRVSGQGSPYQVAKVTSISGNTVTYVPQPGLDGGTTGNPLLVAPDSPGDAVWNGDTPKNLRIANNVFWKNSVVANAVAAQGHYGKGHIEFKTVTNSLVEGNDFSGFGAGFTITSRNQPSEAAAGSNPWATITNLTFRSNRWRSSSPSGTGPVIGIQLIDNNATTVPGRDVIFENNLFEDLGGPLANIVGAAGVVFRHNTVVGPPPPGEVSMILGYPLPMTGFKLEDNIFRNNEYGLSCPLGSYQACYPGFSMVGNVILDNRTPATQIANGPLANGYPAGNYFPSTFAQIGFVGASGFDLALSPLSPYRGRATNGTDPGVDMPALIAALNGATSPLPTPTPTPTPNPSPPPSGAPVNVALASNGGVATASSVFNSQYPVTATNDGERKGMNWANGGGWNDATADSYPDWVQINFTGNRSIAEVDVFTLQDSFSNPTDPTSGMTFGSYGITNFQVEYWTGGSWAVVPGGIVTSNNRVWTQLTFAPITTNTIRVVVNGGLAGYSRITEIEAWENTSEPTPTPTPTPDPTPAVPLNVALAANGAIINASSSYSSGYPAAAVIDGDRKGMNWGNGGGWNDATASSYPDWLEVTFAGIKRIEAIDVFTLQDTYNNPVEPSPDLTFNTNGVTNFQVQYWSGAAWLNVPGATMSANNHVWNHFSFTPVDTTRIRVMISGSLASYSRITEVEAWQDLSAPPPIGVNVALASNGGAVNASSTYSNAYPSSAVNNGDRRGTNWGDGGGWNDATFGESPDWLEVSFNGSKTINQVDVFTVQDNFASPSDPTSLMTFSSYGVTSFRVEYWNGSGWSAIPGASNTANNRVWNTFTFSPITTARIRIVIDGGLAGYSRITEVEAWQSP